MGMQCVICRTDMVATAGGWECPNCTGSMDPEKGSKKVGKPFVTVAPLGEKYTLHMTVYETGNTRLAVMDVDGGSPFSMWRQSKDKFGVLDDLVAILQRFKDGYREYQEGGE